MPPRDAWISQHVAKQAVAPETRKILRRRDPFGHDCDDTARDEFDRTGDVAALRVVAHNGPSRYAQLVQMRDELRRGARQCGGEVSGVNCQRVRGRVQELRLGTYAGGCTGQRAG